MRESVNLSIVRLKFIGPQTFYGVVEVILIVEYVELVEFFLAGFKNSKNVGEF